MNWTSPIILIYFVLPAASFLFAVAALLGARLPKLVFWTKSGPILLLTSAAWLACEALGKLSGSLKTILLFDRLQFVAAFSLIFSWIAYVGEVCQREIKRYNLSVYLAGIYLVVGLILTALNPITHFIWKPLENPDIVGGAIKTYKSGFIVMMAGFAILLVWGFIDLFRLLAKTIKFYSADAKLSVGFSVLPISLALVEYATYNRFFGRLRAAPLLINLGIWSLSWVVFITRYHHLVKTSRRAILENMSDAVAVVDGKGRIVDLNKSMVDLLDIPDKQEALNRELADIWPEAADSMLNDEDRSGEIGKNGKSYESVISKIIDGRGSVASRTLVLRDITASKEIQQAIKKFSMELQNRNEELQQFVYVASHDLQEPLRMVSNYLVS